MKKIYYLGYYDTVENKNEKRNIVLAATNKMTYIIEAMEKCKCSVEVVSAAHTSNRKCYPAKNMQIGKNSTLYLFKSTRWGNKIRRIICVLYSRYQYKKYIINNLTSEDTLIVYHSVDYANFIVKAKKKIGFRLVMEVEEIYADVNGNERDRKKEYKVFDAADAYIFPTELLNKKINIKNKPYAIICGTYKAEPDKKVKFNDGKIHIVYAGTFDPRKGGALASVGAAEFLNGDYRLHILGFGSHEDKHKLLKEIERVSKISSCKVSYDGLLSGEEYVNFIQRCDIGLSTQNPSGIYNDTSFPSKILSYMANGLRVVSIRIPAVETSEIGEYMYYYEEQTPQQIANAIKSVDFTKPYYSREIISQLDDQFVIDINRLLGE